MVTSTVCDGAQKRLQKLDSFDANLNHKTQIWIPRNANLILSMQMILLLKLRSKYMTKHKVESRLVCYEPRGKKILSC